MTLKIKNASGCSSFYLVMFRKNLDFCSGQLVYINGDINGDKLTSLSMETPLTAMSYALVFLAKIQQVCRRPMLFLWGQLLLPNVDLHTR